MPHKQVLFRSDAREKILRGVTALADVSLLLSTEATLTEVPEAKDDKATALEG